jgi:hypothetical protein
MQYDKSFGSLSAGPQTLAPPLSPPPLTLPRHRRRSLPVAGSLQGWRWRGVSPSLCLVSTCSDLSEFFPGRSSRCGSGCAHARVDVGVDALFRGRLSGVGGAATESRWRKGQPRPRLGQTPSPTPPSSEGAYVGGFFLGGGNVQGRRGHRRLARAQGAMPLVGVARPVRWVPPLV